MGSYDVVVIGAGTAGESVVSALQAAGQKIAIIEHEPIGGRARFWREPAEPHVAGDCNVPELDGQRLERREGGRALPAGRH